MAENSRMSKLSEKEDECVFTWKVFTGWDYMIGNAETAHNRVSSIVMSFKEALVEEAEKKRDSRNWKIISSRVFVNLMVINLLIISAVIVVEVVRRSTEPESMATIWRRNEITVVLSLISTSFPMGFEILGIIEKYHPRKALRIHLARIMVLNLLNVYSLIFAQFDKIGGMTARLNDIKPLIINITNEKIYVSQTYGNNGIIECICDGENSYPFTTSTAPIISTTASPHLENATVDLTSENNSSVFMENHTSSIFDIVYNVTTETDRSSEINEYKTEIFSTIPYTQTFTEMYSTDETSLNTTENETIFYDNDSTKWNDSDDSFINTTDTYFDSNITSEETWLDRSVDISGEYYDYYDSSSSKNEKNTVTPTSEYEYDWDDNQTETESKKTEIAFETAETYFENSSVTIETPTTKRNSSVDLENLNTSETVTPNEIENFSEYFKKIDTKASTFFVSDNVSEYYKKPAIKTEAPEIINKEKVEVNTFTTLLKKLPSPTVEYTPFTAIPTCEMLCRNWTLNQTIPNDTYLIKILEKRVGKLSYDRRRELSSLCWETLFGQELVKIVIMDLIMTALGILAIDFFRGLFLRVMNRCWCWDLEKKFPEYGEFKVAENILHLVNNQGMVWMGMFFSPGLAWINVIKLYILMYLRSWTVLTCNVPHSVVFRASRSNNFYFTLLLMMLFLCTLPVGYAVVWVQPSWHCGPFSNYKRIFHIFTTTIKSIVPENLHRVLDYIASPGIIIPLLVLLILIIYYLVSLTNALREANNDLKIQLRQERTEERRKMFKLVDKRRRIGSGGSGEFDNTPFARWKKLINNLPSQKSLEEIVKEPETEIDQERKDSNRTREILTKFIRKALRKGSTSEEENPQIHDDATDNEQHESLPEDINTSKQETHIKEMRSPKSPRSKSDAIFSNFQNTVHSVLSRKKSNSEVSKSTTNYPKSSSSPISKSASPKEDSANDHKSRKDDRLMKWTENIPLITISKTESDESLLNPTSTPDLKVKLAKKLIEKPKKESPAETDEVFENRKTPTALKHRKGSNTKGKEKHLQKQNTIDNNDGETCENADKYKSSLSI